MIGYPFSFATSRLISMIQDAVTSAVYGNTFRRTLAHFLPGHPEGCEQSLKAVFLILSPNFPLK